MKLNPIESVANLDINWRAARLIAIGYLALSVFDLAVGLVLRFHVPDTELGISIALKALAVLSFLSGPAGFLLALATMPDRWTVEIITSYFVATCMLALFLTLSCHRKAGVRVASLIVTGLLWLVAGLFSLAYVFAYAA